MTLAKLIKWMRRGNTPQEREAELSRARQELEESLNELAIAKSKLEESLARNRTDPRHDVRPMEVDSQQEQNTANVVVEQALKIGRASNRDAEE